MIPLRRREWFQDAYIHCAAIVAQAVMFKTTPPDTVKVIETQLERAYKMGVRDGKSGKYD